MATKIRQGNRENTKKRKLYKGNVEKSNLGLKSAKFKPYLRKYNFLKFPKIFPGSLNAHEKSYLLS